MNSCAEGMVFVKTKETRDPTKYKNQESGFLVLRRSIDQADTNPLGSRSPRNLRKSGTESLDMCCEALHPASILIKELHHACFAIKRKDRWLET
jgi:hypothetical protein